MTYHLLHTVTGIQALYTGAIAPLLMLSHIALGLVVGLLVAVRGLRQHWPLAVVFLLGTVVGLFVFLEWAWWVYPYNRDFVSFGLVVLCGLALAPRRLPVWVSGVVSLLSGVGAGYLLVEQVANETNQLLFNILFATGYVITFAMLIGMGTVATLAFQQRPRLRIGSRLAAVALLGVGVFLVIDTVSCRSNLCAPLPERDLFAAFGA